MSMNHFFIFLIPRQWTDHPQSPCPGTAASSARSSLTPPAPPPARAASHARPRYATEARGTGLSAGVRLREGCRGLPFSRGCVQTGGFARAQLYTGTVIYTAQRKEREFSPSKRFPLPPTLLTSDLKALTALLRRNVYPALRSNVCRGEEGAG